MNRFYRAATTSSAADAETCAPASSCASENMLIRLDTAVLAVSIFIILSISLIVLSLIGLRSIRILVYVAAFLFAAGWVRRRELQEAMKQMLSHRTAA